MMPMRSGTPTARESTSVLESSGLQGRQNPEAFLAKPASHSVHMKLAALVPGKHVLLGMHSSGVAQGTQRDALTAAGSMFCLLFHSALKVCQMPCFARGGSMPPKQKASVAQAMQGVNSCSL